MDTVNVDTGTSLFFTNKDYSKGVSVFVAVRKQFQAHLKTEIPADSSGVALQGIGCPQHLAPHPHYVLPFPRHANDGSRDHVLHHLREERLVHEVPVATNGCTTTMLAAKQETGSTRSLRNRLVTD